NENVSSGSADQGPERNGAAQEAAALLRTAATALLSAAEIWSTNTIATPQPVAARTEAPATSDGAPAKAEAPEAKPEETSVPHRLRPSEVLAEAQFFRLQGKRPQDVQGAPNPPPLPPELSIDVEIVRALEKHAGAALFKARDSALPSPPARAW